MLQAHRWLAAGVMAAAIASPAHAAWPERPITLIIPAAPGGTTDIAARLIADKMAGKLGQQVIVENRAGAAGTIRVIGRSGQAAWAGLAMAAAITPAASQRCACNMLVSERGHG